MTQTFWTICSGEACEVELVEETVIGAAYLVRNVEPSIDGERAEWETLTGLFDTRIEALITNGLA